MNIRLANDQDESAWNAYIGNHPAATPYHRYAWKKAVEQAYGHKAAYFIAEEGNRISGILPTVEIKPPLLAGELCALPFCDLGECLADDETIRAALIRHAAAFAEKQQTNDAELTGKKLRMLLDLPGTANELAKSFKSKLCSQINKAIKNGLTFRLGREPELIDVFYEVFTKNMRSLGSPVHSKQWFEAIRNNYGDNLVISTVWKDDAIAGAGIVLFNGKMASIPWASTIAEFNRLAPNMLLYWSLLEFAADQGYEQFDFGRSTLGEGTFNFKKQWGARPAPLNWQVFLAPIPVIEQNGKTSTGKLRSLVEFIWRKLPLSITIAIGPRLRKYISL